MQEVEKTQEAQGEKIKDLEEEVGELSNQVEGLLKDNHYLAGQLAHLSDYGRRNTVEKHGVPYSEAENLLSILEKISEFLEVPFSKNHLDAFHRIPNRPDKPIIVKFANRWALDAWKQSRNRYKLNTEDIGFDTAATVYFNPSISKEKSFLLMKAKDVLKPIGGYIKVDDGGRTFAYKWYKNPADAKANRKNKYQIKNFDSIKEAAIALKLKDSQV